RLPPFALRAPLALPAGLEGSRFQSRRLAVEDEHRLDAGLDEVRRAIDESRQVGRHATLPVHQGRTVRLTDDREKLIQRVESVDRQDLSGEVLKFPRLEDDDVREIDAHPGDRGRGILKSFLEQLSRLNVRTSGPTVYAPASAYRVSDGGRFVVGESRGFSGAEGIEAGRTRMGRIVAIEVLVVSLSFLLGVLVIAPPASATDPIEDLGTLPGDESSRATAINDAGQIVGVSGSCTDLSRAFFWDNGTMTDLGSLPGTIRTYAWAINDAGQVAGSSGSRTEGEVSGFRWEGGVLTDLGGLGGPGDAYTGGYGINSGGQVVGASQFSFPDPPYSAVHAFRWTDGTVTDLGDLGFWFSRAVGINGAGLIVGWGAAAARGQGCTPIHAVRWTGSAVVHDVAVSSASAYPLSAVVGTSVSIDATIENLGTQAESFDVQAAAGSF